MIRKLETRAKESDVLKEEEAESVRVRLRSSESRESVLEAELVASQAEVKVCRMRIGELEEWTREEAKRNGPLTAVEKKNEAENESVELLR